MAPAYSLLHITCVYRRETLPSLSWRFLRLADAEIGVRAAWQPDFCYLDSQLCTAQMINVSSRSSGPISAFFPLFRGVIRVGRFHTRCYCKADQIEQGDRRFSHSLAVSCGPFKEIVKMKPLGQAVLKHSCPFFVSKS